MKRIFILVLFTFLNLSVYGVDTKGNLSIDTKITKGAIVGETYRAVLTLVPFSLDMIRTSDLEKKTFLDYFYISRVRRIKISENNVDAIQVFIDLVIVNKFENKSFKIWSLHDRNIPVNFNLGTITKTDLTIQKFITFNTSLNKPNRWNWKRILGGLLLLLAGVGFFYMRKQKKLLRKKSRVDVIKELEISKGHADFEWIYRNRKTLMHSMDGRPEVLENFKDLITLIEQYQFQSSWQQSDISELLVKKKKILESYQNGV